MGSGAGLPSASRYFLSRRQAAITRAARLYFSVVSRSSGLGSNRTLMTSLRDNPVITETREVVCFRPSMPNSWLATST